jgi:dinuclear metal center YbgI/SA1388 family protein
MKLGELSSRYDEELRTADYAELDASANGLQVGDTEMDVPHVAFAVDAATATIEAAVDAGADALVVHHGLSWGGIERVTGRTYDRVASLVEADIGLYVSHLPLDGHPTLGNAAGVADLLHLTDREPFGAVGPETIGLRGRLPTPTSIGALSEDLSTTLETGGENVQVISHGAKEITDLAIVTGSGADWVQEAAAADVDALLTGEGKGRLYHDAREAELSVLLAGHYATETFGVRNLAELASEWGLETTYISHPTGL